MGIFQLRQALALAQNYFFAIATTAARILEHEKWNESAAKRCRDNSGGTYTNYSRRHLKWVTATWATRVLRLLKAFRGDVGVTQFCHRRSSSPSFIYCKLSLEEEWPAQWGVCVIRSTVLLHSSCIVCAECCSYARVAATKQTERSNQRRQPTTMELKVPAGMAEI